MPYFSKQGFKLFLEQLIREIENKEMKRRKREMYIGKKNNVVEAIGQMQDVRDEITVYQGIGQSAKNEQTCDNQNCSSHL